VQKGRRALLIIMVAAIMFPALVGGAIAMIVASVEPKAAPVVMMVFMPVVAIGFIGVMVLVVLFVVNTAVSTTAARSTTSQPQPGAQQDAAAQTASAVRTLVRDAAGLSAPADAEDEERKQPEEVKRLLEEYQRLRSQRKPRDPEQVEATRRLAATAAGVTVVLMIGGLVAGRPWWEVLALGFAAGITILIWCAAEGGFGGRAGPSGQWAG